jgi:hypothetical protein
MQLRSNLNPNSSRAGRGTSRGKSWIAKLSCREGGAIFVAESGVRGASSHRVREALSHKERRAILVAGVTGLIRRD